jgi:hypothetical protein
VISSLAVILMTLFSSAVFAHEPGCRGALEYTETKEYMHVEIFDPTVAGQMLGNNQTQVFNDFLFPRRPEYPLKFEFSPSGRVDVISLGKKSAFFSGLTTSSMNENNSSIYFLNHTGVLYQIRFRYVDFRDTVEVVSHPKVGPPHIVFRASSGLHIKM